MTGNLLQVKSQALLSRVFSPLPYLWLFSFFTITSINLKVPLLREIHLELLLVLAVLLFTPWTDRRVQQVIMGIKERELILISALLWLAPIFSSLANRDYLGILENDEFKSWTKTLIVCPFLYWGFRTIPLRQKLMDLFLLSLVVFEVVFLYRYFVLGEARSYDLRPTLHTKNGDPNFICTFLVVGIPLALHELVSVFEKGKRLAAASYGLLAIFLVYGAIVTQSRMGLISVAVSLLYLVYRVPLPIKRGRLLLIGLGIALLVASLYGQTVWHRFATINDESSHGRIRSYINGVKLFVASPLFGKGWDSSPHYYFHNSGYPLFSSDPDTHSLAVHNTPLQVMADLGLFGFSAYMWLVMFVGLTIRQAIREHSRLALFTAASFLALILNFLTLPLETKDFVLMFLVMLATLTAPVLSPEGGEPKVPLADRNV